MIDYNEFDCPVCDEVVQVALPYAKWATCPNGHRLEIIPDADFDENGWHDRTELMPRPSLESEFMRPGSKEIGFPSLLESAEDERRQCQHATKLTGQCVKCGSYPYDEAVTAAFLLFCVVQCVAFAVATVVAT